MLVTNVIKDSFIDYMGEQSLVVFSKGCNLDCDVCYNKKVEPQFNREILSVIEEYITPLHTAIVISGGEPTIQDLPETARLIKERYHDLKLKVFTNGQNPDAVLNSLGFVDFWNVDYKTMYDESILGVKNPYYQENVMRTLRMLRDTNSKYEVALWRHPKTSLKDLDIMIDNLMSIDTNIKFKLITILF